MTTPIPFGSPSERWNALRATSPIPAASDAVLAALQGLPHDASSDAALRELQSLQRDYPRRSLRANFQNLSPELRDRLRAGYRVDLASLLSLSEERDAELLNEGFLTLGRSTLAADANSASVLFGIVGNGPVEASASARQNAAREIDALRGTGSFGGRLEASTRSFARQATDPGMLVAMTAGGILFSAGRGFTLSRLLSSRAGFLTRGWAARGVATAAAFPLEIGGFFAAHRAYRHVFTSEHLNWSSRAIGEEIFGLGLTLGLLKLGAAAGNAGFHRMYGIRGPAGIGNLSTSQRFAQALFQNGGSLLGIAGGHAVEMGLNLRPHQSWDAVLTDSLVTLAQFGVAGRFSNHILGPRYAAFLQELNLRSESMGQSGEPRTPWNFGLGMLAATPEGVLLRPPSESLETIRNRPLMMANNGDGSGNGDSKANIIPPAPNSSRLLAMEPAPISRDPTSALETILDSFLSDRDLTRDERGELAAEIYPYYGRLRELLEIRVQRDIVQDVLPKQRLNAGDVDAVLHRIKIHHFESLSDRILEHWERFGHLRDKIRAEIEHAQAGGEEQADKLQESREMLYSVELKWLETMRYHNNAESYLLDDKGPHTKSRFADNRYPELVHRFTDISKRLHQYLESRPPLGRMLRDFQKVLPSRFDQPIPSQAVLNEFDKFSAGVSMEALFRESIEAQDPFISYSSNQPIHRFLRAVTNAATPERYLDLRRPLDRYLETVGNLRTRGISRSNLEEAAHTILTAGESEADATRALGEISAAWNGALGGEARRFAQEYWDVASELRAQLAQYHVPVRQAPRIEWSSNVERLRQLQERDFLSETTVNGLLRWFDPSADASKSLLPALREMAVPGLYDFISKGTHSTEVRAELGRFFEEVVQRNDEKMMQILAIHLQNYQMGMMRDRLAIPRAPREYSVSDKMAADAYDRFLESILETARFYHRYPRARGQLLEVFDKLAGDRGTRSYELAIPIMQRMREQLDAGNEVKLISRGGVGEATVLVKNPEQPEDGLRLITITSVMDRLQDREHFEMWLDRAEREFLHNGDDAKNGNGDVKVARIIQIHLPRLNSGVSKDKVMQWAGDYLDEHRNLEGIDLYLPRTGIEVADLSQADNYRHVPVLAGSFPTTEALIENFRRDVESRPNDLVARLELHRLRESWMDHLIYLSRRERRSLDEPNKPSFKEVQRRILELAAQIEKLHRENWDLVRTTARLFPREKAVQNQFQRNLATSFRTIEAKEQNYISPLTTYRRLAPGQSRSDVPIEQVQKFGTFFESAFGIALPERRISRLLDLDFLDIEIRDFSWRYDSNKGMTFRGELYPKDPESGALLLPAHEPAEANGELDVEPSNGMFNFRIVRNFRTDHIDMYFDYLSLPKAMRGGGVGRNFFGELIRFAETIGAQTIHAEKISSMGRFKLAEYGMQFQNREEQTSLRRHFRFYLEGLLRSEMFRGYDLDAVDEIRTPQDIAYAHFDPRRRALVLTPPDTDELLDENYSVGHRYLEKDGLSWAGVFDVRRGSRSRIVFEAYYERRGFGPRSWRSLPKSDGSKPD